MKKFKFLIATDYSEAVKNAERYAIQIAKATNSTLSFLHVYQVPLTVLPSQPLEYAASTEELYQSQVARLEHHRNELFHTLKINPSELPGECIVCEGNTGKEICEEAEKAHIDFIIVGTHGASGFRKIFLGSHSWDVIRRSKIPVLAIPQDAMFTGINKIVFGTSYQEKEIPQIHFLINFCRRFDAELTILHVTNYVLSKEFEKEMFEKFRSKLEETFSYSKMEVRLLIKDVISEGLNLYCIDNKVDVLAMSMPKISFFEKIFIPNLSMTRKMSFHTHIPLLVIPSSYNAKENIIEEEFYSENVEYRRP